MRQLLLRFWRSESGAQMAEYSLLLILIGLVVAGAALWLSGQINEGFQAMGDCIESASAGDGTAVDCADFIPAE